MTKNKLCKCGSTTHSYMNHPECSLNIVSKFFLL